MDESTKDDSAPNIGHEHPDVTGGWLRPAVFGAMDGLVSNFALIAGVEGGTQESSTVVLAGLAGLAAGAFSMAAGEYTSVASQAEHAQAEIEVERREIRLNPFAEQAELAAHFTNLGVDVELANQVAEQVHRDPDRALEVHAKAELGVGLDGLPSPTLAAVSSFLSFAVGALLPVLPYLFGAESIWPAAVVALLGLFATGAIVTRVTARTWWFGGLRQAGLGALAAVVTYLFGSLVGAGLG